MIQEIVHAISVELNNYLKFKFATNENKVLVASIMDQDGSVAIKEENKIILSVVNIARDGSRGGSPTKPTGSNAPATVSLYLLFAAYFNPDNYMTALKFISGVIGYFQSKGTIYPSQTPLLPDYVGPLSVELMDAGFDELSNMWNAIGAKYVPSVLYRIRAVSISDDRIRNIDPEISGVEI